MHSCNTYFITVGLQAGIETIVRMAQKFHLGERTGLRTRQETPGILPTLERVQPWLDGRRHGEHVHRPGRNGGDAVANGRCLLGHRQRRHGVLAAPGSNALNRRTRTRTEQATNFPAGLVRDELGVSARNLQILRNAMLAETEEGTGQAAQVAGLRICGKTGTAQVMDAQTRRLDSTTWFASFAPYENPRYAVVVMVESGIGTFGGTTCAPIAHDIYEAILEKMKSAGKIPGSQMK